MSCNISQLLFHFLIITSFLRASQNFGLEHYQVCFRGKRRKIVAWYLFQLDLLLASCNYKCCTVLGFDQSWD